MDDRTASSDEDEIRALITDHFEPMRWSAETAPDWARFRQDFLHGAILCGAARPAVLRSLDGFLERMEENAMPALDSFEEHGRGLQILRFGNVAVVLAASELLENGSERSFDVSGYLLVRSEGRWSIMAHAWEQAGQGPLPEELQ